MSADVRKHELARELFIRFAAESYKRHGVALPTNDLGKKIARAAFDIAEQFEEARDERYPPRIGA